MFKKSFALVFLFSVFCSLFSVTYAQETLTITTYYPSPYGSYREVSAYRMKIGTDYSDASYSVSDNNLIVQGNVGIGTASPGYKLHVSGGWQRVEGTGQGGDSATRIGVYDTDNTGGVSGWWFSQNNDGKFAIHQNAVGDRLNIDGSGNVGIGTVSPSGKLDVNSGYLYVRDAEGTNTGLLRVGSVFNLPGIYASDTGTPGHLVLAADGDVYIGNPTAGTPNKWDTANLIVNNGNVGIGRATPDAKLQVIGDIMTTTGYNVYGGYGGALYLGNPNHGLRRVGNSVILYTNTVQWNGGASIRGDLIFEIQGISRMVINQGGNVGIGTDAPSAKLQISGGDAAVTTQGNGVILRATNGSNCFRVTVNNEGRLFTNRVTCP